MTSRRDCLHHDCGAASKKARKAWNRKLKSETLILPRLAIAELRRDKEAEMHISKPPYRSRGFWIVLAVAFCISIGVLIGFHGGMHNEAGAIYDSDGGRHALAGKEEIRLYGAFVLLAIVGVIALATLTLFVSGIFPPRQKHQRSAPPSKV